MSETTNSADDGGRGGGAGGTDGPDDPTADQTSTATAGVERGPVRVEYAGGGRHVAYAEYGDPAGRPIVALHGTPGSRLFGALFDAAACRLGVRVLSPDRPGYGRSSPWPDRRLTDTGAFLTAVLDDAGVERAGVVGFSGGGPHALAFAASHGGRVTSVDVVSGATPPSLRERTPRTQWLLAGAARWTPRLLGALLRGQRWVAERAGPAVVVDQYTTGDRASAVGDADAERVRRDFVEALASRRSGFVTESRLLAREWEFDPEDVDRPVRLWHGERDGNAPVGGARRLADRLPDGRLVRLEADHLGTLLRSRERVLGGHAPEGE